MIPPTRTNLISGDVVDAALQVHSTLGPGLLESTYEKCVAHELRLRRHEIKTQVAVPLTYKGLCIKQSYRLDLLVDDCVIVEVKTVRKLLPVHEAQLLSYLRLSQKRVGLLINFNEVHLRDGIKRLVSGYEPIY